MSVELRICIKYKGYNAHSFLHLPKVFCSYKGLSSRIELINCGPWPNEPTSVFVWPSSFEWMLYFERVVKINKEYVIETICGLQCLKDILPDSFQKKNLLTPS